MNGADVFTCSPSRENESDVLAPAAGWQAARKTPAHIIINKRNTAPLR
jgi:hypothetical protein